MPGLFGPHDELISMRQAENGLLFLFDRINMEYEWERLYTGDFGPLWAGGEDTVENGKAFFKDRQDIKTVNLFKMASEFYQRAVLAERPSIVSQDDSMTKWLEENVEQIYHTLERAVRLWSVKDRLVLLVDADGTLMAIDPSDYFRVSKPYNRESLVGHVIMTRWFDPWDTGTLKTPYIHRYPNRMTIIRFSEVPEEGRMYNDVTTYQFTPSQLVGVVGERVQPNAQGRGYQTDGILDGPEEAGIRGVLMVGDGQSWYPDVKDAGELYMLHLSNTFRLFNIDSNRVQWLPKDALGDSDPDNPTTIQERANRFRQVIRPVALSDGMDGKPVGLDDYNPLKEYMEFGSQLEEIFRKGAGIPEDAWQRLFRGVSSISGSAIERSEDTAAVRIRRLRTGISAGLPHLIRKMSGIEADVEVEWAHSPFEDKVKRREQARQDYMAGAITLEEYRHEIGYDDARITPAQRREFTKQLSLQKEETRQASLERPEQGDN